MSAIDDALAAVKRGDDREALVALLAAWRACRDRELARAIDLVSARAAKSVPLPAKWTKKAASDPVSLHHIVAMFDECGRYDRFERLKALASFDDPRVAAKLVAAVLAGIDERRAMTLEAIAILERLRDPRIVDSLDALAARYAGPGYTRAVRATCKRIRAAFRDEPRLDGRGRATIVEIIAATAPAPIADDGTEAELLAAVYAAPLDDGPREIYADWLLERGDPRGEFIMLQLACNRGTFTDEQRKRMVGLGDAHGERWAGGRSDAGFDRGFVNQIANLTSDAPDDPFYSTITSGNRIPPRRTWPYLTSLWSLPTKDIALLPDFPATNRLETLTWDLDGGVALDQAAVDAYRRAVLPVLNFVSIDYRGSQLAVEDPRFPPDRVAWMIKPTLTELTFPGHPKHLAAYLGAFAPNALRVVRLHVLSPSIVVERDGPGPFTRLEIRVTLPDEPTIELVCRAIESLPPSLQSIRVTVSRRLAKLLVRTKKRLRAAAAKHPGCIVEP